MESVTDPSICVIRDILLDAKGELIETTGKVVSTVITDVWYRARFPHASLCKTTATYLPSGTTVPALLVPSQALLNEPTKICFEFTKERTALGPNTILPFPSIVIE